MSAVIQDRVGSITRNTAGEVDIKLFVYKNRKKKKTTKGDADLSSFLRGFEIYESISNTCMEMKLILEDAAGVLQSLTGTEEFALQLKTTLIDRTYFFRAYQIGARVRMNQQSEAFVIDCVSDEYTRNEILNVFGNSETIFNNKTESTQIIKELMGKKYINTAKKLYLEKTLNKQTFISPNWRPFDLIYWMSQRSIRKSGKGQQLQNGFAFFENALGFHYKSIDSMINLANDQDTKPTNPNTEMGDVKMYTYTYTPKAFTDPSNAQLSISAVSFPKERNFLMGLRHGNFSGYSVGFDPTFVTRSSFGSSTDLSADSYKYSVKDLWGKMAHLAGSGSKNPHSFIDEEIKEYTNQPKRVRFQMLPNQIFDPKFQNNPQRNYEQIVELQAYQWMRIESLKNIQLVVEVPGNLDLYAGAGVNIVIPSNTKTSGGTKVDRKYSGRYIIGAVSHKTSGLSLVTELNLLKDSMQV